MVFELMERNMYEWIKDRKHYLPEARVKRYVYVLLKILDHIHRTGVFHRDIKPENILLRDDLLKLADFGSCRGTNSKQPYTEYISTRWYRPPECLLTDGYYDLKMDIWGVGCIFFEVMALHPLFPGKNELDQVIQIHRVLGSPPENLLMEFQRKASHMEFNFPLMEGCGLEVMLPNVSPEGRALISRMLMYDSTYRPTATALLKSAYFRDLREQDTFTSQTPILRPVHFRSSEETDGADYSRTGVSVEPKRETVQLPALTNAYMQKFKVQKPTLEDKNRFIAKKKSVSPQKHSFYKSYL